MQSSLRSLIREMLLQEEVFGSLAFVYHGSNMGPANFIRIINSDKFKPGEGDGDLYGKGLYTVYDLPGSATDLGEYGKFIYKFAINLNGYLCFDKDAAQKVYGKPLTVIEQMTLLNLDNRIIESTRQIFENTRAEDVYTSDYALPVSRLVRGIVKGLVFTGRGDGKVAVIYDASTAIPVSYKTVDSDVWTKIDNYSEKQVLNKIQSPGRMERYEKNSIEQLKQLKRKIDAFNATGKSQKLIIKGNLDLSLSSMTNSFNIQLPDNLHVKGDLIAGPTTAELPKNLRVDGNLNLHNSIIEYIPDGTRVGGAINVPTTLLRLPDRMEVSSFGMAGNKNITDWPSGCIVKNGDIFIEDSVVKYLPDNLTINYLSIRNTPIDKLPRNLVVHGNINLERTNITNFPDDLKVRGQIYIKK